MPNLLNAEKYGCFPVFAHVPMDSTCNSQEAIVISRISNIGKIRKIVTIEMLEPNGNAATLLIDQGFLPAPWSAAPGAHFAAHRHSRAKRLYVVRGDIRFNQLGLSAPQGIRIPAGFEHEAWVGDGGVECVEAFE